MIDQRVAVCRDHANSQCRRKQCKYYHIPIVLPPANIMAAMITNPGEQQETAPAGTVMATTSASPPTVAAGYKNNLIIIEPQKQQQQSQQQQFSYHTNNTGYYHSNIGNTGAGEAGVITATYASNMYPQQQQPHITYHCSSPYSPSSTSSSSSCSIAASPTLSSATTLSTTSTVTMPTPQQQYPSAAAPTTAFLKPPAYYTDASPTLVLSSDYNSNCIPIQAAPFISLPQQHMLKYSTQPPPPQQHRSLLHHQSNAYVGHHYPVVGTTMLPATTITVTPTTITASSSCI